MNPWIHRRETAATDCALDSETVKRIQWLFERVCRHGYGAEQSLREAVQVGAARMAEAGATHAAIRSAVIASVHGQAHDAPSTSLAATESRVMSVQRRMTGWVDAVHAVPEGEEH
jgi:hypothetical protein